MKEQEWDKSKIYRVQMYEIYTDTGDPDNYEHDDIITADHLDATREEVMASPRLAGCNVRAVPFIYVWSWHKGYWDEEEHWIDEEWDFETECDDRDTVILRTKEQEPRNKEIKPDKGVTILFKFSEGVKKGRLDPATLGQNVANALRRREQEETKTPDVERN